MDTSDADHRDEPPEAFAAALLRNPLRADIVGLLRRSPGMNKHQLAKTLGVNLTAVEFHLQRLEEADLVAMRPGMVGRETICFASEDVALWENPSTRVLLGRGPPREVAFYLARHPGADVPDVAAALGVSVDTVRRHLRTLERAELIQKMRVERQVIYRPAPELLSWVENSGWDSALKEMSARLRDR